MVALPQEDLLIYQRAEIANREVLDLLQQITRPSSPFHDQALSISRRLATLLADMLRSPVAGDPDPPAPY
ncbi:MAG: hypothetical protein M3069_10560 [Chloroflexota bacterium]|nr:hypothetical protein [Chloroflexota bacterium]